MADVLKERGLFWWSDVPIPATDFAPAEAVVGTLTITDVGRVEIELDNVMPSAEGRWSVFKQGAVAPGRMIAGLLKSDDHTLAINLIRSGGRMSTYNVSYDRFVAQTCLVSSQRLPVKPKVRAIDFNLSGFEEWLDIDPFKTTATSRSIGLRYKVPPQVRYGGKLGALSLTGAVAMGTGGTSAGERDRRV